MICVVPYPSPDWQKYLDLVIDPSFNAGLSFSHKRGIKSFRCGMDGCFKMSWPEVFCSCKSLLSQLFFLLWILKGLQDLREIKPSQPTHADSWVGMWVGWKCKDVSWEQGMYGGLIQSSSIKQRRLWKREHVFNMLLIFPHFAFYFLLQGCYFV